MPVWLARNFLLSLCPQNSKNMFVQILIVLDSGFAQYCFVPVARQFQYAHGAYIAFQYAGKYPVYLKIVEDIIGHDGYGLRHNAPAPEFFTQPVTNLGVVPVDVILNGEAYVTNCLPANLDRKVIGLII